MTGPGRLVLKGGLSISSASSKRGSGAEDAKKTKKKKRKRKMKDEEEGEGNEETKQDIDEMQAAQTMQTTHMRLDTYGGMKHQFDRRTPAEKRFDAVQVSKCLYISPFVVYIWWKSIMNLAA